jgi:hypothetical protein
MSSESSSFPAGVEQTSGSCTQSLVGAPCPSQLSMEAIASFPSELPPLDDSCLHPAAASSAAALRARFVSASSDAQALMLSMREVWAEWQFLPTSPAGTRDVCGSILLRLRSTDPP